MRSSLGCVAAGEEDCDGGAVVGGGVVAGDSDAAAVFFYDALRDPKAEAGAVFALGGEEGLEEFGQDVGGDS